MSSALTVAAASCFAPSDHLVVAVFQWYEQEMTEARMRDRPLYGEVKSLFDSLDEDGSVRRTIIAAI